jgi:hypothetical protein
LLDQDDALGSRVLVFESGLEKNTLVIAFRRTHEFFHMGGTDKFSRERIPERCPARLHQPNELTLRPIHPEILRFEFERFFVITVIEKLEPMERRSPRVVFISAFLRA